jgi:hypothetical protein
MKQALVLIAVLALAGCGSTPGTRPPMSAERTQLGYLHVGGVWEIVVGPRDWSGVWTSTSPRQLVDLYCD